MELTIIAIITIISVVLSLTNKALDIPSKILDIKKKRLEIKQMTATMAQPTEDQPKRTTRWKIREYINDGLSVIALIAVSYKLWAEYTSSELLTREIVLTIGLLFSLAIFNILSLFISRLERRLGRWVDDFLTALEQTLELIQIIDFNAKLRDDEIVGAKPTSHNSEKQ